MIQYHQVLERKIVLRKTLSWPSVRTYRPTSLHMCHAYQLLRYERDGRAVLSVEASFAAVAFPLSQHGIRLW